MPNFAQEYPLLLFLPCLIFVGVAVIAGILHLAVMVEARIKARQPAVTAPIRDPVAPVPVIPRYVEPNRAPHLQAARARIRLVSTKL